jgi:hypothetical protein
VIEGCVFGDESRDLILFAGGDDFLELPDGKIGRNTMPLDKERDVSMALRELMSSNSFLVLD